MKSTKKIDQEFIVSDHASNESERIFAEKMQDHGFVSISRGWPDFLSYNPKTKQIICTEVKPHGCTMLSHDQYVMLKILSLCGIECYKYSPDRGMIPFIVNNDLFDYYTIEQERREEAKEYQKTKKDI